MMSPFRIVISFITISIIGLALLPQLPIAYTPDYALPTLQVTYHLANASPEIVEQQATAPLENAFSQLSDIKTINSQSGYNRGSITIAFYKHADIDFKKFEVSSLIRQLYPNLNKGLSYPLVSLQHQEDNEQTPILIYSILAPYTSHQIQKITERNLRLPLMQLDGLEAVHLNGATPMQLTIRYKPVMLHNYEIDPTTISLRMQESFSEFYSGIYKNAVGQSFFIKATNSLQELQDIENLQLKFHEGLPIYLKDVADVYLEEQQPQSYYRINGLNAITMNIEAQKGTNKIALANKVKALLQSRTQSLPAGYALELTYDDTRFLNAELTKIYWRSGLSVVILLLFILLLKRNVRYLTVLFTGILINLSITALLMYLFGLNVHLYTLAGLTISFGLIMDNAIVMLDHLHRKKDKRIILALFAASLTTIAALSIIWFLPDKEKQNLLEFAQVISLNLGVSLLVALLFTPAMHAMIMSPKSVAKPRKIRHRAWVFSQYSMTIHFLGGYKKIVVLAFILLFGIPIFMLPSKWEGHEWYNSTIGSDFYQEKIRPYSDKALGGTLRLFIRDVFENSGYRTPEETKLYVNAELSQGHTIEQMNYIITKLEEYLKDFKGIDRFIAHIYSGEYARTVITFKPGYSQGIFPYQLKNKLISRGIEWGGVDWSIYGVGKGFSNQNGEQLPSFRVLMKGYNYKELEQQAEVLAEKLLENKRIQKVNTNERLSWNEKSANEWVMSIDEELLAMRGYGKYDVVQTLTLNSLPMYPTQYTNYGGTNMPVQIYPEGAKNFSKYRMMQQPFLKKEGHLLIGEFASLGLEKTSNTIHKEDRQYIRVVGFDYFGSSHFGQKYLDQKLLEMEKQMPIGYTAEAQSWSWNFDTVKRQYSLIFILIVVIYFICAILFENLRQPFIIIGTIPISFIGLFLTFAVFGFYFDQGGYAAFILLGGLVVNAAIFIINDLNNMKIGSHNRNVIKATAQKSQPIFLTTLSTCLGLIPFLLEGDKEIFWFSLAAGTIGGLIFSMVAVFVVLPVLLMRK